MLQVELNHILSEGDALARIQEIFSHVENQDETYVITKDGSPTLAIVSVKNLEQPLATDTPATPTVPVIPPVQEVIPSAAPATPLPLPNLSVPQAPLPAPQPVAPQSPSPLPVVATSEPVTAIPAQPGAELPDMPEDLDNDSPLA